MAGGYTCEECGGKPGRTEDWFVGGGAGINPETGNKVPARRYCSLECAVTYLLRRDGERDE